MSPVAFPTSKLGLRFRKSQARVLRNIADDLAARQPDGVDISLYEKAAESAERGEPLLVHCDHRGEVEEMAAAFARLGVARPEIDELDG